MVRNEKIERVREQGADHEEEEQEEEEERKRRMALLPMMHDSRFSTTTPSAFLTVTLNTTSYP